MAYKIKAPTGLAIKRDGNKFICSWKLADTYDAQFITAWVGGGNKKYKVTWNPDIGKKTKEKSFKIDMSRVMPSGAGRITAFKFKVSAGGVLWKTRTVEDKTGKKTKVKYPAATASDESETKTYTIKNPKKPALSASLTGENTSTYSWSVAGAGSSDATWFQRMEWETILIKDANESDGSKYAKYFKSGTTGWDHGTSNNASGSKSIQESSSLLASGSYTRWFRARAIGPAGYNEDGWAYTKHVYAAPYAINDTKISSAKKNSAGGIDVTATWNTKRNNSHPVEQVVVEYVNTVPNAGLSYPPGTTGWKDIGTIKPTSTDKVRDSMTKSVDDSPQEDRCMFIRANAYHDNEPTEGKAVLAYIGVLKSPTNLSVSLGQNHAVTITAQNASEVPDAFLVVRYTTKTEDFDIGIIPRNQASVTVQCPDWGSDTPVFGVYAVVGSYSPKTRADGITSYSIKKSMQSSGIVRQGGELPNIPQNVRVTNTNQAGTINVSWEWSWSEADSAELSWSDHEDAWYSTDAPNTYVVQGNYNATWNIAGLETGKVWYVRVRLIHNTPDNQTIYGGYSEITEDTTINLSSAPAIPSLTLSPSGVATEEDSITASWGYASTDGTYQAFAVLAEVTEEDGELVYTEIAHTNTAQHLTFTVAEVGWSAGERHGLAVRVTSASGHESDDWSNIEYIDIAERLNVQITSTSLVSETIIDEDQESRTALSLKGMPLTVTVGGTGENSNISVVIERYDDYHLTRPDERDYDGFENETIAIVDRIGDGSVEIVNDDLIGHLDDEAQYRIVAIAQDTLGQRAEAVIEPIEVHWQDQALIPDARVIMDDSFLVARLMPIAPDGVRQTDVCDIYRLSTDRPQLIYQGASWGQWYVDPYPTIGASGGYRFVFRTANNDYITQDGELAWVDIFQTLRRTDYNIIDFGNDRVILTDNIDLSSTWEKDFQETKYLGGSVQGDWNPAVSRTGDIGAVLLSLTDQEMIESMRRLADYAGRCHVRTKDGSTYTADVQISEDRTHNTGHLVVEFSLNVTRVDTDKLDGMTYEEWLKLQGKG